MIGKDISEGFVCQNQINSGKRKEEGNSQLYSKLNNWRKWGPKDSCLHISPPHIFFPISLSSLRCGGGYDQFQAWKVWDSRETVGDNDILLLTAGLKERDWEREAEALNNLAWEQENMYN